MAGGVPPVVLLSWDGDVRKTTPEEVFPQK
jgi:hypothetical protein